MIHLDVFLVPGKFPQVLKETFIDLAEAFGLPVLAQMSEGDHLQLVTDGPFDPLEVSIHLTVRLRVAV